MNKFNGYTNPDFALKSRVKQNTWAASANQLIPNRLHKKKFGVFPIPTSYT